MHNNVFTTIGASNHSKHNRAMNDFYATNPKSIDLLLDKVKKTKGLKLSRKIWECAAGNGHLSIKLKTLGYDVFSTDIIKRKYKLDGIQNFLTYAGNTDRDILTNPPYKYAQEFVEKGMSYITSKRHLILFLKLTFLEGQARKKMFQKFPPKHIFIFSKRISVAKNGVASNFDNPNAIAYAWFIWEKGFAGKPQIHWI